MTMNWLFKSIRPWDIDAYGESDGDAYCPDCDLGFVDLRVKWYEGSSLGTAICPECGQELEVMPPEDDE